MKDKLLTCLALLCLPALLLAALVDRHRFRND